MRQCHAKTAEPIKLPFETVNRVGPGTRMLVGRAHWRQLANTAEQLCVAAVCGSATMGGDAACSQITLGNLIIF